jgi:paired amphipathic helix protein Sin3a
MKDFNKTVDYVHRIKQRFASDPDTYIEFLELLQRYQKEQMSISVVYRRVHMLFKGQLDLLEEFQKMLPADHNGNQGNTSGQLAGGNGALLDSTDQIQPASSNRVPMKDNSTERKGVDDDRMSLVGSLHRLEDIPNPHLTILQKRQASEDPEIRRWEPHPAALPAVRSKPELGTINLPLLFSVSATQLTAPPHKRARTDSGVEVHSAQVTPSTPSPGGQSAKVEDSILPIREARNVRSREMASICTYFPKGACWLRTSLTLGKIDSFRNV